MTLVSEFVIKRESCFPLPPEIPCISIRCPVDSSDRPISRTCFILVVRITVPPIVPHFFSVYRAFVSTMIPLAHASQVSCPVFATLMPASRSRNQLTLSPSMRVP
jgi:hypothetical protein